MASILGAFQAAQAAANKANLQRYKEGIGIYDEIITRYGKKGSFTKGQTAQLERTKKRDTASGMQSLVSSGLAGTTMAAGLGKAWEEDVGAPTRLSIADIAGQRLSQAQLGKAGFIERREDEGPNAALIAQLMQGMGQASVSAGGSSGRRTGPTFLSESMSSSRPSYPSYVSQSTGQSGYTRMKKAIAAGTYTPSQPKQPRQPTPMKYSYGEQRYYA